MDTEEDEASNDSENILKCYGKAFFDKLEERTFMKIPEMIRNILVLNDVNCASVLESMNDSSIVQIEQFMKNDFNSDMLNGKPIADYLGIFQKRQQSFTFSCGQKIMLEKMIQICKKYVQAEIENQVPNERENSDDSQRDEEAKQSKKKHLELLYKSLYTWISGKKALIQVNYSQCQQYT